MKTFIHYLAVPACLIFLLSLAFPAFSQNNPPAKADVITMLNGETKLGRVIGINSKTVKFAYTGETLEYELEKSAIAKIEFSSGRLEVVNAVPQMIAASQPGKSNAESRKNKIAVLPFEILTNDANFRNAAFSREVQQACVDAIRGQSPYQQLQDPMVTNATLAKLHFTTDSLLSHTPQEWAEILDVEYVVVGAYSIQNKGSISSTSGYGSYDSKKDEKKDKTKGSVYASSNTYTSTNYDTKLNLRVYNDAGNTIFSEHHSPVFGSIDSYKPGLKWLAKRSPFKK